LEQMYNTAIPQAPMCFFQGKLAKSKFRCWTGL
jgi:hypothetical protein